MAGGGSFESPGGLLVSVIRSDRPAYASGAENAGSEFAANFGGASRPAHGPPMQVGQSPAAIGGSSPLSGEAFSMPNMVQMTEALVLFAASASAKGWSRCDSSTNEAATVKSMRSRLSAANHPANLLRRSIRRCLAKYAVSCQRRRCGIEALPVRTIRKTGR